jgi:beta-phosphoglucomutase
MNQLKCCIFDLDGVICDTAKYHYLAWKSLAEDLNIPFTEQDNERLKGVSRMESLGILLSLGSKKYSDDEKRCFAERKNNRYIEYICKMTRNEILPGVENLLLALHKNYIKVALGSVSKNASAIIDSLQIESFFDVIIDGNKVTHAKPDPEVFLLAAKTLDIAPENCVVFEDAITGVQAAHRAGMKCIGIGNRNILAEADLVVADLTNITLHKILSCFNFR